MRGSEVGLHVVEVVEAFEFVSDAFDLERELVPGMEDATCATFPDCVATPTPTPTSATPTHPLGDDATCGVGVGVGVEWVGVGGVRVVR